MNALLKSCLLSMGLFQMALWASPVASFNNHARAQIYFADGGAYPSSVDYSLGTVNFGKGSSTFGGGQQGSDGNPDFTWTQIVQFDVDPAGFADFNAATEFSLSIQNGFTNTNVDVSVYASTLPLNSNSIVGNGSAPVTLMADVNGSGAVNRWFQDQTPHQPGGPMASLGSFTPSADGLLTISNNAALNSLLSGTSFDASTPAIYLSFVNNSSPADWAPPGGFSGSTLTAIPEPSTLAFLALSCICLCGYKRRRS